MTTKPSDMKPSDRIRELAGKNGGSVIHATVQYLDERHVAGHRESEPVLAPDEAAWADYRARSAPVAEPPAQPVAAAPAYRVDIALLRQAAERCRDAKPDGHELLDALRHLQGCFGWQTVLGLLAQLGAAESKLDAIEGAACVAAEPAVLVAGEAPTGAALLWKMFGNRMGDERYCHMLDGAEARSIVDERAKLAHERYEALLQVEQLKTESLANIECYLKADEALTASNERAERLAKRIETLPEHFDLSSFVNAGLSLEGASTALTVSRLILEDAEQPTEAAPPVATGERPWDEGGRDDYYSKLPGDDRLVAGLPPVDQVATGERAIVVGSTWLLRSDSSKGAIVLGLDPESREVDFRLVGGEGSRYSSIDRFLSRYEHVSDPPTPATGGEGDSK